MATLIPNGRQVFLDLDGKPLAGGFVFFFVPGTTLLRDTFQDPGATQKNTNPIVLDAAGTATIFGVGSYRQVLKAADGTLIWDRLTADTSAAFASWAGTATGTANHIALRVLNFTSADGQAVDFIAAFTNTGAIDVSTNGAPAIATVKDAVAGPVPLVGGEIVKGNVYRITYDATAGLFHLSYLFDRAYVDAEDAAVLAAANTYAAGQGSSALSQAKTYAAQQAAAAQATAISVSEAYAVGQASAAQSAAQTYAAGQAASALSQAQSYADTVSNNAYNNAYTNAYNNATAYAAGVANNAYNNANAYTNTIAANTTAEAHGYADVVSNNAYNNANTYAQNAANVAQNTAIGSANNNTYRFYIAAIRLVGYYVGTITTRQPGSVMVDYNSGTGNSAFKYLQFFLNGQWVTIADG